MLALSKLRARYCSFFLFASFVELGLERPNLVCQPLQLSSGCFQGLFASLSQKLLVFRLVPLCVFPRFFEFLFFSFFFSYLFANPPLFFFLLMFLLLEP